jgi:cyclopropane-fatty-acyl-phospholipid synthase
MAFRLFALEHSRAAYVADFALYTTAVVGLAAYLVFQWWGNPESHGLTAGALIAIGLCAWTIAEYSLHRFVLHGIAPFNRWHAEHHRRPRALIYTPTVLNAALIAVLVYLPIRAFGDLWSACAVTLGFLVGNLAYSAIHHATHHWQSDNPWLLQRKRWHARHHHPGARCCYGVSMPYWDHAFGSAGTPRRAEPSH